ncbi:WD40 repeat-like protein [Mycena epipterygia]|nr:WD40 repeat-like protein [Mycena epipterygia]
MGRYPADVSRCAGVPFSYSTYCSSSVDPPSSVISLQLFHDSRLRDTCLGAAEINIGELMDLCVNDSDGDAKIVKLELMGMKGELKEKPLSTLFVSLMKKRQAAALAVGRSQRGVESSRPGATTAAFAEFEDVVTQTGQATPIANSIGSALLPVISKLEILVDIGDEIAKIHPYANIAWKILTSVYTGVKKQQDRDDKLCGLVETMAELYSFMDDVDKIDLPGKIKRVEERVFAIVKQTVECALFIQEYTAHGFISRAVRNTWSDADKKIEKFSAALCDLKKSFEADLTVQFLFISTKILDTVERLDQSDMLKKLNPMDMNAIARDLCLAGTRREILDDITEWFTVPSTVSSKSGNILWLSGVAGSGKSTISTTVAESTRGVERLGAFLFFDRNEPMRSHPDSVIRTIAYSLALSNPYIGLAISDAIRRDPAVVNAPLRTQFKELLLDPLREAEQHITGPLLVILDALDECGDPPSRRALLSLLSDEFPSFPHFLRVLITSRRESDIAARFRSHFEERDLNTVRSTTKDVEAFIRHQMAEIRELQDLESTWPGEQKIQALIDLSGGLFIWASTATKFLIVNDYQPDEQLELLISQKSTLSSDLDHLYGVALRQSAPWTTNKTFAQDAHSILMCIVLGRVPMTAETMDMILSSASGTSAKVLGRLGCVIQWSHGSKARTLHASFADYLTDPLRSKGEPWSINPKIDHHPLALGCLQILNRELKFNICGLEDSHCLNVDVPNISSRVADKVPPHLVYSSCFWFSHIQDNLFDQTVLKAVTRFMYHKFLYWLEVLSLLEQVTITSAALRVARDYAKARNKNLEDFVADAIKFVAAFAPVIAQSAPHIYLSALPFTPHGSRIAKQFRKSFPNTLQAHGALAEHWPSIQKVLRGHSAGVFSVHFSPDGTRIVSGSWDKTLHIWDTQTGAVVVGPLEGHTSLVNSVCFSPDGTRVVSGSYDYALCIWDAQTGALLLGPLEGHTNSVNSVHFSPDGMHIVSGSYDKTLRIWNAQTGVPVGKPLTGHTSEVNSVCFSPDGTQIASASDDQTVRIWEVETCEQIGGPLEHASKVLCVRFSPNGMRIVSSLSDNVLCIWEPRTGLMVLGPLHGHTDSICSVSFSPDGVRIASGSWDDTICIWDAQTGELLGEPLRGHTGTIYSVDFSSDSRRIVSGSSDTTLRIWDAQINDPVAPGPIAAQADGVRCIDFSPDGAQIVSGYLNSTLRIWDTQTGALIIGPLEGHNEVVDSVRFSPDGTRLVSGSQDKTLCIWDTHTGALVFGPLNGHTKSVSSVDFFPDGTRIVSGSYDSTLCIWDAQTGRQISTLSGHDYDVNCVRISPDSMRIVSGSDDGTLRSWDAQTGALVVGPLKGYTSFIASVDFSPDGTRLVSGSGDTLQIWDAETGKSVFGLIKGHTGIIRSVHFSPDGRQIVSGSDDAAVRIWDAQTGAPVASLDGHTERIIETRFSPDGTRIVSISYDNTIRIWDAQMNKPTSRLQVETAVAPDTLPDNKRSASQTVSNTSASAHNPFRDNLRFEDESWLLNAAGEHIFWVPPWHREGLYLPQNTLVIRAAGATKLDLSRFVHGTEWQKCIDPAFRDAE